MTIKYTYRVQYKFGEKENWIYSIWFGSSSEATNFIKHILDNTALQPGNAYFKITEKADKED